MRSLPAHQPISVIHHSQFTVARIAIASLFCERAIPYPDAARGLPEPGLDAMRSLIESTVT